MHNRDPGRPMGWEWRKGGRYYYQARWANGRVVKEYVGSGLVAEFAAALGRVRAERRRQARLDAWLDDQARPRDGRTERAVRAADAVLAVWLPMTGLHRPKRGAWRRKRGAMTTTPATLAERVPLDDWGGDALRARMGPLPAALTGDKPAAAAVGAFLAANPAAVALYGDLARRAVQALAKGSGGPVTAAAVVRRADAVRRALAGECPTPVELLLAERAAVCWAACQQYEWVYFDSLAAATTADPKTHLFHERRIDAASRRLLATLRTLAVVRRLKLPDLLAVVRVDPRPVGRAALPEPHPDGC